ncbi:MAG: hypothetical protein NT014_04710 [Candidatus Omnitrophica bacterium]|nr:hypothetical protein [Candidatus Omnitrophota bacterium]
MILFIAVSVLLTVSTGICQEVVEPKAVSTEEYEVYSDLLTGPSDHIRVVKEQTGEQEAFLSRHSFTLDTADYFEKQSGVQLNKEMVKEFIFLNNAVPVVLENKFNKSLKVHLISNKERQDIFKSGGGWEVFRKKYPNSCIVEFSRVAFNAEKNMAFIYSGIMCDSKAGNGQYLLLKKENTKWVVVAHVMAWIS